MTKKLLFVGAILLALSLTALAADVTGKWVYEQPGRGGGNPSQVTLDLKASGSTVTGTVTGGMGRGGNAPTPVEIKNGKISGDTVTFEVVRERNGEQMVTKYEGTVTGSEMKLKVSRPGQDGQARTNEFVAKKSTT